MSQDVLAKNEVYSLMEADKPYASYIKTILGQVAVTVWDNALEKPVDVILTGNPKKKDESCIVKVWSDKENSVFKRMNARHFKNGLLIAYEMPEQQVAETSIEQASDEDLKAILKMKFMAFKAKLDKIDSEAVLFRLQGLAEEMDRASYVNAVEARIVDVQTRNFPSSIGVEED